MNKRSIILLGQPVYNEDGAASAAVTPGMLVSGITSIAPYATAAGNAARAFALDRPEMGKTIDDVYAIGDTVKVGVFHQGEHVLALIAAGQNIAADARLEAGATAGTLRVFAAGVVLARALEAVDNTAGPGNARIRVEVM